MRKIILTSIFFFLFIGVSFAQVKDTFNLKTIQSPEPIGKHLTEILMNRGDIQKSPYAIKREALIPDVSEYEDSPAMLFVHIFSGYETTLPCQWGKLLFQADSLKLNKEIQYLRTDFIQETNSKFSLNILLSDTSSIYMFSSEILIWAEDLYVLDVSNEFKIYANEVSYTDDVLSGKLYQRGLEVEFENSVKENIVEYNYNELFEYTPFEEEFLPSLNLIGNKFIEAISSLTIKDISDDIFIDEIFFDKVQEKDENLQFGKSSWLSLVKELEEIQQLGKNKNTSARLMSSSIYKLRFDESNRINGDILVKIKVGEREYNFSVLLLLIQDEWKVFNVSGLEEAPKMEFQF